MQLSTRLWLSGALLPALVMGAVLFGAQRWLRVGLERSLDQALLAQAAVESVSLFDGPERRPHLHMASSPLVESVRGFAPEGVLFGPDGHEVMRYPPVRAQRPSERLLPGTAGAPPTITTREHAGVRERLLTVTVSSPSGEPYTLRLTAQLAQVDAALRISERLSLAALVVASLALVLVQTWLGRTLRRRLREMADHVEALRRGDLDRELALESQHDELAALRGVLVQATFALKQARDAKERLLADAAHELRTPLTLMRTSIDLALRRDRSVDELRSALRDVRLEVDRLAALATRLLDTVAAAAQNEPRVLSDVSELVSTALQGIAPECTLRHLTVSFQGDTHISANVRPLALRQAVDNLLSNAVKYAAGTITVALRWQTDRLVFSVRDDGAGVPAPERELIFEPFHRLPQTGSGAGLGLAIVREVARAHGGRVYVQPATPGAEFVLELADARPAGTLS